MTKTGHRVAGQRPLRVGEELRHALAHLLERGEIHDPRLAGLTWTVTEVRVSPDLRNAMVFLVAFANGPERAEPDRETLRALQHAKGFLRRRLAEMVRLRYIPDLVFRMDDSFDQADRIARVLRDPTVARDLDDSAFENGADRGKEDNDG